MESYPKVLLTTSGDWKPSDIDDDGQWEYYDDNVSSGSNISDTSYTQSNEALEPILAAPQYKSPSITFTDNVDLTKGATVSVMRRDDPIYLAKYSRDNYSGIGMSGTSW